MARPKKTGLEYFPIDVDIASDEKIEYLEGETGIEGFGIYIKLLAAIYRNGYFIPFTKTQLSIYSRRFFVDKNTLSAVVSVCRNIGLFDEDMFSKFNILTSHGIQTRYLLASERRQAVDIIQEFCLLDAEEIAKNKKIRLISAPKSVIAYKNTSSPVVNVDNNPVQSELQPAKTPQSKVKESNISTTTTTPLYSPIEGKEPMMDEELGRVVQNFSDNIHPITPMEFESLQEALEVFSADRVIEAISRAVDRNKRSMGYVRGILKSWKEEGYDNPGEVGNGKEPERSNGNGRRLQSNARRNKKQSTAEAERAKWANETSGWD
ncbi:Lin1244/Lin1753 domain-containing protein [Selenomonas montiformis]|uniref:Lin1244/Lin1753 domain-containing protein n=1 Tax=Selenomonas montiformis TaxID=2652285 RepID=UPI003F8BB220